MEDLDAVGAGEAQLQYTCNSDSNFQVAVCQITRTDIAPSIEDYLREIVWPALQRLSKGSWNGSWRLVASVYTSASYVLVGGAGKGAAFALSATGSVLSEYGDGKISAQIAASSISNVDFSVSAYQASPPALVGLGIWHFEGGQPKLDQFG